MVCGAPATNLEDAQNDVDNYSLDSDDLEWIEAETTDFGTNGVPAPTLSNSTEDQRSYRSRLDKERRSFLLLLHRVHLQCLLARGLLLDYAAGDLLLQARMLSIHPGYCHANSFQKVADSVRALKTFSEWFKAQFRALSSDPNIHQLNTGAKPLTSMIETLNIRVDERTGLPDELCTLFASLMRALGMNVRIISAMNPISKSLKKNELSRKSSIASKSGGKRILSHKVAGTSSKRNAPEDDSGQLPTQTKKKLKGDEEFEKQIAMAITATNMVACREAKDTEDRASSSSHGKVLNAIEEKNMVSRSVTGSNPSCVWCEVFCGTANDGRWVHVDPLKGIVDRSDIVEDMTVRSAHISYVTAFGCGGVKDVTRRYTHDILQSRQHCDEKWWSETIQRAGLLSPKFSAGAAPSSSSDGKELAELLWKREEAELDERAASQQASTPKTISEFKMHTVYVLQRHIKKFEALATGALMVGLHKGEPYYLRKQLVEVHAARGWKKRGREIKASEIGTPYKTIEAKTGLHESKKEAGDHDHLKGKKPAEPLLLYGIWQTDELDVPIAKDGIVPKNVYGNVEVPPLTYCLPTGTVHLSQKRLIPICKKLGIDYAPAVVGFDRSRAGVSPAIEGVVICSENKELVLEQYHQEKNRRECQAREKREQMGRQCWIQVLGAVWSRLKLDDAYGTPNSEKPQRQDQCAGEPEEGLSLEVEIEEF